MNKAMWPLGKDNPACICDDNPNINCDVHVNRFTPYPQRLNIEVFRPSRADDPARLILDGQHIIPIEAIGLVAQRLNEVIDLASNNPDADTDAANPPNQAFKQGKGK